MIFDMDNLNPATIFYFNDDKPKEGGIEMRLCDGQALIDIDKKTIKPKVEYKKGQRFEYNEVNDRKREEMIWDFSIVGLPGVKDKDGKAIEPTIGNKVKLMRESSFFAQKYVEFAGKLNEIQTKQTKAVEKN